MFQTLLSKNNAYILTFARLRRPSSRDLARNFITGCPNWDFKNLGCPKSMIEKVKTITLIIYINKYMLNSSRNVFFLNLELVFIKKNIPKSRVSFYVKSGIFDKPGSPKAPALTPWREDIFTATPHH